MMKEQPHAMARPGSALTYAAYTGSIIAVSVAVTILNRIRLGERGWMFTWQLVAIAVVTALFAAATLARVVLPVEEKLSAAKRRISAELALQDDRFTMRRASLWCLGTLLAISNVRLHLSGDPGFESPTTAFGVLSTGRLFAWLEAAAYIATGLALLVIDHRLFVLAIALLQAAAIRALETRIAQPNRVMLTVVCVASWALASGMTYTRLGDWLLSGALTNSLAIPAFLFAFALVVIEMSSGETSSASTRMRGLVLLGAVMVFAAYALRTDNLIANWVPLHRSYFADVSDFVRAGHWLLWDVPSAYGFLSILTLAIMPGGNGWQATYELIALFLTIQCVVIFTILRWGRAGAANALFAILLPLAAVLNDGISRYAWSGRLYPQGGLRFFWIVALLFVIFLMHAWRANVKRVNQLRWLGHTFWLIAVFWSVENALWATLLWLPYLAADILTYPDPVHNLRDAIKRAWRRAWPLAALPAAMVLLIESIYRVFLGTGPDWMSYVEFSGAFAKGQVRPIFHVQYLGASWIFLIVLGAIGALALLAIRARRWDLCPLLVGTWCAVWGTSTYFALEPLDMYVTLLLAVMAPAIAIVIYASRQLLANTESLLVRLSVAPIAVIIIAVLLGEPARMAAMTLPFTPNWHADVIQDFPPISGELQTLMRSAGIRPGDAVLLPNGRYWTELTQGMILQFARSDSGKIVEYRSWLPISPIGPEEFFEGLPKSRQRVYIDRYLARSTTTGWYITYRRPARCSALSPRLITLERQQSANFSAARCALK